MNIIPLFGTPPTVNTDLIILTLYDGNGRLEHELSNPTIPAPAIWLTELTAASMLYFKKPGGGGDQQGTLACFSQRGRVDKKPPSSDSFKLLGKCFSVKSDHFWLPNTPENAAG